MTQVPGVVRRRETPRLGRHRGAELRHVGPAERNETGRPELFRQVRRHRERHVAQRPEPERRRLARDRAADVLEQDRDTAERAIRRTALGLSQRVVEPGPDHRIQLRVDRLDPGDRRLRQFPGTNLTAPDKIRLRGGIKPRRLIHTADATCAPGNAIDSATTRLLRVRLFRPSPATLPRYAGNPPRISMYCRSAT